MTIPDEAVEAAAKAVCEMSGIPWSPYLFENDAAKAALEAAIPLLLAGATQCAREELVSTIHASYGHDGVMEWSEEAADAILAAGYRKIRSQE